jgi:hypothetical protein
MVQLVNEPTHFATTPGGITETCLDLIITDSPGYVTSVNILPPLGSKHATVHMKFQIAYPRDKSYMRHIWDYDKGNYQLLNETISSHPWGDLLSAEQSIDDKTVNWTNTFLGLCKDSIPNRVIRVKPRDVPWITTECKRQIRVRDRAYKKLRRVKTIANMDRWKNLAREVRLTLNTARYNYRLKMKVALSDPSIAPKKYWSLIKKVYGSKKGMSIPALEIGDKQLCTSVEKANAFTDYFQKQQTLIEPVGHGLPALDMLTEQRLDSIHTTPEEIKSILGTLELGKAHGADGVSVRLLKETASTINSPLCALINDSFRTGQVPLTWKQANVSPVHKKESKASVGNYRPISLLSLLAKVQERVVFKRLYAYLARNNLLTAKNSGFKEKDSAICQLINIVDKIYKALENGKEISMVFLDISKAFDKVWHKGLLHKLKANGINGSLLDWLENYLSNREIRVVINGQCAQWAKTNAGVPQGSILGPLLFLVFINDVVDDIDSDINLFADDTSLMNIIDQLLDSYTTVNSDLKKLATWSDQWLVTYNATKTVALHITKRREGVNHPPLFLKGTKIAEVPSHCHLGIDIENAFTWSTHISRIAGKGAKCVGLMRRASMDLPRECLENLYLTMVRPILEYGGILFDGSPDIHTKKLDRVQREAALVCTGAYKHTKTVNLMDELGWDTLSVRRVNQKHCLMYKIQKNLAPPYLIQACPPLVGEVSAYNLRNAENISLPSGKKTGYMNSFMQSSIRAWNKLDINTKGRGSLDSFKYHLKKSSCRKKNKLYKKLNGRKAINHARMRMGLSGLKGQRHAYNHVPLPTCDFCGARREDVMHYMLQCGAFTNMRTVFLEEIENLYRSKNITLDLTRTISKKELIHCLLRGDPKLSEKENIELFKIVQHFICSSKRF